MEAQQSVGRETVTLFLCGDVMTGRGIDQILQHPSPPPLHEPCLEDALDYVRLAEQRNGPIPRHVDAGYIWGDALEELALAAPDATLINLETSITTSDAWDDKGINYRMHPDNVACLRAARLDCCALANNHVLDWGDLGLAETLRILHEAGIRTAGAGRDLEEARAPAVIELSGGDRVLVAAFGTETSGIPSRWGARPSRPGVHLLPDLSDCTLAGLRGLFLDLKRARDLVVASIHWGGNWGYEIPPEHRRFAHALIDKTGVDVVHGHSSHHPLGIEVYRERPILYGAGDFLNDYEGIGGMEQYRGDLCLMYFAQMSGADGRLLALEMSPMRIRRFRLERASVEETAWLHQTLDWACRPLGSGVSLDPNGRMHLTWRP